MKANAVGARLRSPFFCVYGHSPVIHRSFTGMCCPIDRLWGGGLEACMLGQVAIYSLVRAKDCSAPASVLHDPHLLFSSCGLAIGLNLRSHALALLLSDLYSAHLYPCLTAADKDVPF